MINVTLFNADLRLLIVSAMCVNEGLFVRFADGSHVIVPEERVLGRQLRLDQIQITPQSVSLDEAGKLGKGEGQLTYGLRFRFGNQVEWRSSTWARNGGWE